MVARNALAVADGLLDPTAPLGVLPGIGPTTQHRLGQQGLRSLADLIQLFPRRCRQLVELTRPEPSCVGQLVRLRAVVRGTRRAWLPGRRSMVTVEFAVASGEPFSAAFFNQPWLAKAYAPGDERIVEGTLQQKGRRFLVQQARVLGETNAPAGPVQVRYPDVEGVSPARLQQWLELVLQRLDWSQLRLPPLPRALATHDTDARSLYFAMHRPANVDDHERARAHFAVREAVVLFTRVDAARRRRQARHAAGYAVDAQLAARIHARLPFALTTDQHTAVQRVWQLLAGPSPMGALLQGDVGTGKTAVAIAAALAVLARGHQVAFLAPTELLAEQHWRLVGGWLASSEVRVHLLTAGDAERRQAALQQLAQRGSQLVFGTHALLAGDTQFQDLGLVIVDEQHRFGVEQRMQLVHKAADPHVLVMSATPIPRTLALVQFGDLELLTLRQRPHARSLPPARWLPAERWSRAVRSIARAVRRGGRVFVVCPAIGEDGEQGGVVRLHKALARQFACGLVHGRLRPQAQQAAIAAFVRGDTPVLVGTTVLEVGVDVPAATLMVVVKADRFGLATLHQLRGRVGRGVRRGLSLLCGPKTERVQALCRTTCGFELAEADLLLRGSGELLGTAQSGFSDLRALDPVADRELLQTVRAAVAADACKS